MGKIDKRDFKKKKFLTLSTLGVISICIIILFLLYLVNKGFRGWIDSHILGKDLTEGDIQVIDLNIDRSNQVHVYSKYIAILNDKTVTLYNSYGEKIDEINVDINTGVFDSAEKYFVIAEKEGNEVCLIFDKNYLWSATVEGKILQAHVNRNGYVAVITEDVTHKSVLTFYNEEGKKLFTSYFSSTRIIDASISKDNKYIAVAELDTAGTSVQSNIKIISIEKAQNDPENTIIYTYNLETGDLITNVEYQEKGQISYVYDNGISVIKDKQNKNLITIDNDNITFIGNDLINQAVYVYEKSSGLFKSESNIHIVNTYSGKEKTYQISDIAKEIYAKDNIIAINTGMEIHFINTGGWLVKKYTAKQEITNIEFSNELAAIVYKDKIIIISF